MKTLLSILLLLVPLSTYGQYREIITSPGPTLYVPEITQLGRPITHRVVETALFNWTPRASYHECAVKVRAGSAGGSGVWCEYMGVRGVLTAAHVVEGSGGSVTCTWPDGHTATGKSTTCKYQYDVAFVYVFHPKLKPLPFAKTSPKVGDLAELVGYGGPKGDMRHFTGTVTGMSNDHSSGLTFSFKCMNGDSGSGILNANHEVIGIQSVGMDQAVASRQGWPIYGRSGSGSHTGIRGFFQRIAQGGSCLGGNCSPGYGGGGSQQGGGGGGADDLYPPDPGVPPAPPKETVPPAPTNPDGGGDIPAPVPPPTKPAEPPKVTIDMDALADKVIERMKQNPEPFRGLPGKDGTPGLAGPAGPPGVATPPDLDAIAAKVKEKLPPIKVLFEGKEGDAPRSVDVALGGQLIIPPVRMDIKHPNGQRFKQQKPLGDPIILEIVPEDVIP